MIQCKHFIDVAENEVNNFLFENPQYRYISHTHCCYHYADGVTSERVLLFYDTSPGHVARAEREDKRSSWDNYLEP